MSGHSGQSMTSYQSAWMSHLEKNGSKEMAPNNISSSSSFMNKDSSHPSSQSPMTSGKEAASSGCSQAKALEEIKSGFSIIKNGSPMVTSTATGMEARKLASFPSGEGTSDTRDNLDFDTKLSLRCYVPPDADKIQPSECHSGAIGVSQSSRETIAVAVAAKPHPFSKDLDVSSTDMLQLGPGQMIRPISSFVETGNLGSQGHLKPVVISENKETCHLNSGVSLTSDPSKANGLWKPGPAQLQDIQAMMLMWNQINHPAITGSNTPYNACSSSQQMLNKLQELENLRCPGTLDSMVPLTSFQPGVFSPATQSMLITRTGLDSRTVRPPANRGRVSAPSRVNAANALLQLHAMPPPPPGFGFGSQGVKIPPVVDKGKRVTDGPDQKNEVSAEIAPMDLDESKQPNPRINVSSSPPPRKGSVSSSPLPKKGSVSSSPPLRKGSVSSSPPPSKVQKLSPPIPQITLPAPRPPQSTLPAPRPPQSTLPAPRPPQITLPDPRPPGQVAAKPPLVLSSLQALKYEMIRATLSRTESLGMETTLTQAEPLHQCKAEWCPESSTKPEPGPWLKRLKLNAASDSSGMKLSSVEELYPHEKKALVQSPAPEPTAAKTRGVELVVLDEDENEASEKLSESSRSWMRRWCRVQPEAPQTTAPEKAKAICAPQSSNLASPEPQQKQFPSIAAMALMGKAMNGFQHPDRVLSSNHSNPLASRSGRITERGIRPS